MFLPLYITALCSFGTVDSTTYELVSSIEVEADYFTTDNVGNIYVVEGESITTYDENGEVEHIYSDKLLGDISTLDALWALKPVAFYKEPGYVVFLDNTLSVQGEPLNLAEYDVYNASVMCTSYNNGLWFYDPLDYRLIKTDENLNIIQTTDNLNQLISQDMAPVAMLEKDNRLYLLDEERGIMIFDQFGSYYNTIEIADLEGMWVQGDIIYYLTNGELGSYNQVTFQHHAISLPNTNDQILNVRAEDDHLFVQTPDSIEVYHIL